MAEMTRRDWMSAVAMGGAAIGLATMGIGCDETTQEGKMKVRKSSDLMIGWAQADLTPREPVLITGQFHARVSEGVHDPITATALALESATKERPADHAVIVSCDFVCVPDPLRDAVRARLSGVAGLDPRKVFFHATHTHTGPELRAASAPGTSGFGLDVGVELQAMDVNRYVAWAVERLAEAVRRAWEARKPGGISFGLGQAVVGHNRRWTNFDGVSCMYGNTNDPRFSHIEGYEDHAVNLLFTHDRDGRMTGLVVNLACPSQVSENDYQLGADYWHEAREEIRRRHGRDLFILGQCSAAGDQSPHHLFRKSAEVRMLKLQGRTQRQEIARRIANTVDDVWEGAGKTIAWAPTLAHRVEALALPLRKLTEQDVKEAMAEATVWRGKYETLKQDLQQHPEKKQQPRWYVEITHAYRYARWCEAVRERFQEQGPDPRQTVEFHVLRLGEVALATDPFEYYLDFGVRILARSPATQTFLVQLTGAGSYVPSKRASSGGSYGAKPASTPFGCEAGAELAEATVKALQDLWA
jgi:hypothetical protein